MELQVKPSTPPKVPEERRKKEIEATVKIEEEKTLYAKEFEQVSQSLEALIDDE